MAKNNTAYDMRRFAAAEPERNPEVRVVRTRARHTQQRAASGRQLLLIVMVVALMIGTVYSRAELNETRSDINSLQADLTELESQNAYLNYCLESSVSLKFAEDYAAAELGLIRVDSSRINYVNLQDGNRIVAESSGEQSFFESCIDEVMDFIASE